MKTNTCDGQWAWVTCDQAVCNHTFWPFRCWNARNIEGVATLVRQPMCEEDKGVDPRTRCKVRSTGRIYVRSCAAVSAAPCGEHKMLAGCVSMTAPLRAPPVWGPLVAIFGMCCYMGQTGIGGRRAA